MVKQDKHAALLVPSIPNYITPTPTTALLCVSRSTTNVPPPPLPTKVMIFLPAGIRGGMHTTQAPYLVELCAALNEDAISICLKPSDDPPRPLPAPARPEPLPPLHSLSPPPPLRLTPPPRRPLVLEELPPAAYDEAPPPPMVFLFNPPQL